jgi:RND superfamily putative drug exporter
MDYEVFLLSRIKEEYDRTGDNGSAVADGLALTARVIIAAAAIMVCVFGSFVFGPERSLQLLGDRNWWLPRWLDRMLPRVHIEARRDDLDDELAELTRAERVTVNR